MKLFYKLFSIPVGLLAGQVAKKIFEQIWGLIDDREPPRANHEEAEEQAGGEVLRRWLRAGRPRPLDLLLQRDFGAFEDALGALAERGFVLRGGG